MAEEKEKLIEVLNNLLSLTPYESKAYAAILTHGPLSPQGVNQKSGIPRPRTYDVLNGLVGKGLLMEQPGRPPMYAVVEPRLGLERMLMELERKMVTQMEEKRKAAEELSSWLEKLYERSHKASVEEEKVWVTRRDNSFLSKYCEAIRNIETELVIATPDIRPPEKEVLEAVEYVLKKKKRVRVVRQIMPQWGLKELSRYRQLIMLGDQVKYLKYDGLRYGIFDRKDTVMVLPAEGGSQRAIWVSTLPSLASILYEHFEELWQKAQPALPILEELIQHEQHRTNSPRSSRTQKRKEATE